MAKLPLLLGRLAAAHIVLYTPCARRAANVSDDAGYEVFNVPWAVCPSKSAAASGL